MPKRTVRATQLGKQEPGLARIADGPSSAARGHPRGQGVLPVHADWRSAARGGTTRGPRMLSQGT